MPAGPSLDTEPLSVLIVEDDIDMARLIEALLRDMGVTNIGRARNGKQAIDNLRKNLHNYDLIISDWQMPEISGIELLREVRKRRPELPFLMLTVNSGSEEILAAKDAQVTAYMSKPFKARDLQLKILTITGRIVPKQLTVSIC
ncbi:MAG: response regulator [Alphaproteobacteria bacterium]|nr:response regulator [Alphaproteobacteria bacterium]